MTRFTASNKSAASLKSSRKDIWDALTDPVLLPKLTPYLNHIDVDGDRWTWHVTKVPVLGRNIGSTFTEVMTFDEPKRIGFEHDPQRTDEKTAVQGEYDLEEEGTGTRVSIELGVTVELPFPKAMRRPVEGAIAAVMAGMGRRFAHNLLRHLGEK
jgi:carbon monoxide dehydrogenase subunit G